MKGLVWDPVLFKLNKLAACLKHLETIEGRDAQLQVGLVHALKVLVATEDYDFVIDSPVCFGSLEALNRVVKCSI